MDQTTTEIFKHWQLPEDVWDCLNPYERSRLEAKLGEYSSDFYRTRLEAVGMSGLGRVVDAGCGAGHWALIAAQMNGWVTGVDISPERLLVGKALAESNGVSNLEFKWGSMDALPLESASQDGVFCYGALMFGPVRKTIREFRRVLVPGGLMYCNANSYGWYAHLLLDRGIKHREPAMIKAAARFTVRTMVGADKQRIVTEKWLHRSLTQEGFKVRASGPEGTVRLDPESAAPTPVYPEQYHRLPGIIEVVAEKIGD